MLNRLGAQPARSVAARTLYRLRRRSSDAIVTTLVRDGIVVVEDFLRSDNFAALDAEADQFMADRQPTWLHQHGTTEVRHHSLPEIDLAGYRQLEAWSTSTAVAALASGAERRRIRPVEGGPLLEHLTVGDGSELDDQTQLHIDTFFNTHKMWLYLDDVTEANCAFVFVCPDPTGSID